MKKPIEVLCSYCGAMCELRTGAEVYRHRPDLGDKFIYVCPICPDSRVGCHNGTKTPLGTTADAELRRARMDLHNNVVDPLWRGTRLNRGVAYAFIAYRMGIAIDDCHIAMFDLDQCARVAELLANETPDRIRAWDSMRKRTVQGARCPACGKKGVSGLALHTHLWERTQSGDVMHEVAKEFFVL